MVRMRSGSNLDGSSKKKYIIIFCIPIIFSLLYLPFAYVFAIYAKYEVLFILLNFKERMYKKIIRRHKLKVIGVCKLSYKYICKFEKEYIKRMYISMRQDEFIELIKDFKSSL